MEEISISLAFLFNLLRSHRSKDTPSSLRAGRGAPLSALRGNPTSAVAAAFADCTSVQLSAYRPVYRRVAGQVDLAQQPHVTQAIACRKLMHWISLHPQFQEALKRYGMSDTTYTFTPVQVRLIVEAIGEP